MRMAPFALAAAVGVVLALLGSEPLWLPAVAALLIFPVAANAAAARLRSSQPAALLPATLTALTGGLLTALALRLALAAPGWLSATAADCGAPSTGTQQLVLWTSSVVFFLAAFPVAVATLRIGGGLRAGDHAEAEPPPLSLYPVAVALAGLALIAAGFVTTC